MSQEGRKLIDGVVEVVSKDYVSERGRKVVHRFVELIMKSDASEIGREGNWCDGFRT